MVIREWRGRTTPDRSQGYPAHFRNVVMPELRRIAGFLGAELCRCPLDDGRIEYLVLTRWRSLDAIRAFAGPDYGKAVVEPGAVAVLTDFDATARHYEVIDNVPSA